MAKINGVKKNGLWNIKASRDGIKCDMEGVICIKSYIAMIPSFLKQKDASHA